MMHGLPAVTDHPHRRRHRRLIERLSNTVDDARLLAAFAAVPRHLFVDPALASRAYDDDALPIGAGQTISRPSTVARMLALLGLNGSERVLEIGAGCGYQTALLGRLARRVYAIERIEALVLRARRNLRAARAASNVVLRCEDGRHGWPEQAPFDAIVAAACGDPPPAWKEQLREGGVLVFPAPQPDGAARIERWVRQGDGWRREVFDACRFVPLVGGVA